MKTVMVIYWSGSGNTKTMAEAICKGIEDAGEKVILKDVGSASIEDINSYSHIALGCPSMGAEVLEEVEMEPFIDSIQDLVKGKKILLFGSYGWGAGEWMRDWEERMRNYGADLIADGLIINETPDQSGLDECTEFGKQLANS
ncbi:flavodoxin [Fusibacter ferrireducens]|uniref:Flavodoxin n=1 Tax=Fusibacter ferrireducens TaxID=2785058 RepID=A0ABR9ZVA2_9FIRM|nr:flavodoxin [Fusibacter ferrireducens]MBF4694387.1 flavodoxin [Fusibacter ferrireducens]